MQIRDVEIDALIPYENNPRKNDKAVDAIVQSIKQCGYITPIIVDENMVVLAGHTRLKALKKMKKTIVPVAVAEGLTEEQKRKFRLLDNKTNELADWDMDMLAKELEDLDFGALSLDWGIAGEKEAEETYTNKVEIPQYEITGDTPMLAELADRSKTSDLIKEIKGADIPDDIKEFLELAAFRHVVFDYGKIAEFYAQADEEVQELMERSALVIIDYGNALANGYVQMTKKLRELVETNDA